MDNKKKNTGLIFLIVILFLFVLGLGGYIVYSEVSEKNIENKTTSNTVDVKNTENNYQLFLQNLKKQISKYDSYNKNQQSVLSDIIKNGYEVYINENGSLFVKYNDEILNSKFGEYKISDNVLSFYVISDGQSGGNSVYFINENGTVGKAETEYNVESSSQITVKKDIGYKNIISIVNGTFGDEYSGAHGPIFIDINGNIFSENLK